MTQGINFGASLIKLRTHIAAFTGFIMPFSLTNCRQCWNTMKNRYLFCLIVENNKITTK